MFKKILLTFITAAITFMFFGTFIFASDIDDIEKDIDSLEQYLTLKNAESQKILKNASKELIKDWQGLITDGKWSGNIDALLIVKMFANTGFVKFLTVDFPLELSYDIGKEMINMAKIVGAGDVSGIIGKIEEITVKKAVEYATGEVFKNEVRIGSGAIVMNYIAKDGQKSEAQINYLISKKYINDTKSEVIIKFYSPKTMNVPENPGPVGVLSVVFDSEKEIEPFIVTLKGEMKYDNFGYSWVDSPDIEIEYPKKVPDFKFTPVSFWEEKIVRPIKESFKELNKLIDLLGGSVFDAFRQEDLEIIDNNEDLKQASEEIKQIEEEIANEVEEIKEEEFTQTEKEFAENIAQLNYENQAFKTIDENVIVLKDNMSDEEVKAVLIALYKELLKRKDLLSDIKLASQANNDDEENDKKDNKEEKQEEKKEEKQEEKKTKEEKQEISYCKYQNQNPLRNSIIINEVAWMGTPESSSNEWIELKNITNKAIDLDGYQLLDKADQIQIVFENIVIEPNQYILLERTDDNSVPNVSADLIYKGNLNNSNEALYLFNASCELEDIVQADLDWPGGNNNMKKSMERKTDLTWQTYSGNSFGTPKANNSEGEENNDPSIGIGGGGDSSEPENQDDDEDDEQEEITYCLQNNLTEALYTPVIINEVAWMGTPESSSNEWIELKNITNEEISLAGYQLLDKDNQIKIVFDENDMISPNGFYLLERTDDNSVLEIAADKIYTGALSNTDESLRLFDNNCALVDEVLADSDWSAGDKDNVKSMERKTDLTWQTYLGDSFGTPKAENSEEVEENDDPVEIPNPASQYCEENEGQLFIEEGLLGQYGVCVFGENMECEEWAMYDGKCPIGGVDTSFYETDEQIYCAIRGGQVNFESNLCITNSGKTCGLTDYYNGTCDSYAYATSLIVTHIEDSYVNDNRSYVRIYNQSGSDVELCSEDNCTYLAYFSDNQVWNSPYINIKLPEVVLQNNDSFQIDLNKDNRGDYAPLLEPFEGDYTDYIYANNGSFCLFNKDVSTLTEEEAKAAKIDCVGWRYYQGGYVNNIHEGQEILRYYSGGIDQRRYVMARKIDPSNNLYFDRENNNLDFEHAIPEIYTVPSILEFNYEEIEDKTKVKLSFDYDYSLDPSKLSYKIYYTENSEFDENNLIEANIESSNVVDRHVEVIISPIDEFVDYRFKVKLFEEGGNESELSDSLFYTYYSSFENHLYSVFRYDINMTNETNYAGPQNDLLTERTIIENASFPYIDKFGNIYTLKFKNGYSMNQIASYDKNGLLRWTYDLYYSGGLFLRDGVYSFSENSILKLNYRGEKLWETYLNTVSGLGSLMEYNNLLYFYCGTSSGWGICKRGFEENDEIEQFYTTDSTYGFSNLIIDESGNFFFVEDGQNLVKLKPDGEVETLEALFDSGTQVALNISGNKLLLSALGREVVVDKDSLKVVFEDYDDYYNFDNAIATQNGFYVFRGLYGYMGTMLFIDTNANTIEAVCEMDRPNHPPITDANGNLYYVGLGGDVVGYTKNGDAYSLIFRHDMHDDTFTDLILIDNKLYYVVNYNLVELSFE